MKLVAAIAGRPELFGRPERAHLDIYRVVGHVQNEMATDDNFQFNKVWMLNVWRARVPPPAT